MRALHRDGDEHDERGDQRHEREGHLRRVPDATRRERLEQHPDEGAGDDDEHRRDRAVVDVGGLEGGGHGGRQGRRGEDRHGGHYFVLPSAAEEGAGSETPTWCSVVFTAGLSRSSAGLG